MAQEENGWKEWRNYVLNTLDKMENRQDKLENENQSNAISIAKLSTKATVYGTIAGLVTSAILSLIVGFALFHITGSSSSTKNINSIKERSSIERLYDADSKKSNNVRKNN